MIDRVVRRSGCGRLRHEVCEASVSVLNILGRKHLEVSLFTASSSSEQELTAQPQRSETCSTNEQAAVGRVCGCKRSKKALPSVKLFPYSTHQS